MIQVGVWFVTPSGFPTAVGPTVESAKAWSNINKFPQILVLSEEPLQCSASQVTGMNTDMYIEVETCALVHKL